MKLAAAIVAGLLGVACALPAEAATVTVHSTIDLTQWNLSGGIGALGSTPDSASYTNGDTIILDLDFLGSQTLKFDSVTGLGGAVLTNMADCPHSTASLTFHDFSGGGGGSVSGGQYQGCAQQIGANFPVGSPGFPTGAIEFSGVTFTFANIVLTDNATHIASGGRLDMGGTNGNIGQLVATGSVPEPSSWAFLLIGFGALGAAVRRRKSRSSEPVRLTA